VGGLAGRAGRDGELVIDVIEIDIERREMPRAMTPRLPHFYFDKKARWAESSWSAISEPAIWLM
jgi:hypothetical protein